MALPDNLRIADLQKVGEGEQGIVYLIDPGRCIKVYKKSKYYDRELAVLQRTAGEPRFPKLFKWGHNYIIREYIPGIDLITYLKTNALTEAISGQLLEVLECFKRLRFRRIDTRLAHIIVTPDIQLRLIDPTNAMNKEQTYPKNLLAGLEELGVKRTFLEHVKKINPQLYERWGGKPEKHSEPSTHHGHRQRKRPLEEFLASVLE